MIYPTRLAVLLTCAGALFALAVAVMVPDRWYLGLAWPAALLLLTIADAFTGARVGRLQLSVPPTVGVGQTFHLTLAAALTGAQLPRRAEAAVATGPLVGTEDDGRAVITLAGGRGVTRVRAEALRRGAATVERAWLRWRGPLGLAWRQQVLATPASIAILPDLRSVRDRGARLIERQAVEGLLAQRQRGDGAEFEALVEFQPGMERRAIDWKQSARHGKLFARDVRTERNNQIVFALDAGRQMAEPVAGLPRIDRAVSAMLLAAWVALKLGDRVALHSFDSRPRIASGLIGGTHAFAELQRLAAQVDYSGEETNHGFALTTLAQRLHRRSIVVLFTEFTDLTQAGFAVRAAQRLVSKHLLLVVILRDEELEAIVAQPPVTPDDVARAVTAGALLKERRVVLLRLQRMGVHVVESEHERVGERLIEAYVDLKRRHLL